MQVWKSELTAAPFAQQHRIHQCTGERTTVVGQRDSHACRLPDEGSLAQDDLQHRTVDFYRGGIVETTVNDPVADRLHRRVAGKLPPDLEDFPGGGAMVEFARLPVTLQYGLAAIVHDLQLRVRTDLLDLAAIEKCQVRIGLVESELDAGGASIDDRDAAHHGAVSR